MLAGLPTYHALLEQRVFEKKASRTGIRGVILLFSPQPGTVRDDDEIEKGGASSYTSDLIAALRNPRTNILSALLYVNKLASDTRQRFNMSLEPT